MGRGREGAWQWRETSTACPFKDPDTLPNAAPDLLLGRPNGAWPVIQASRSGPHLVLLNQWSCSQAITALMNGAEVNREQRDISQVKRLKSAMLY